jgi:hypothetical protein
VARRIRIEVDGTIATADLHDDESPKTAEAFWQSLPIDTAKAALADAPESEAIVCSIYPGTLMVTPRGELAFLSYGIAEYRDEMGTQYAARVARVREGFAQLKQKLASLHDNGQGRIKITRLA